MGIVDTDEIVVFAHQGEVDQWNREEEFLRLTLDAPLKASTLEGLRDDLGDWEGGEVIFGIIRPRTVAPNYRRLLTPP